MTSLRSSPMKLLHLLPLVALMVPAVTSHGGILDFIAFVLVYGLFAMSLNLLVGYTGLVSFGHAMFFALGAYGFCLGLQAGLTTLVALAAAVGGAVAFAFLVGAVCVRLRETHFSFITLACAMLVYNTIEAWTPVTGGDNGLTGMMQSATFLGASLATGVPRYLFIAAVFSVSAFALYAIVRSSFGATLRMIRDNEARTAYLGVNVYLTKLIAFTAAALFAALAGVLATLLVSGAYPSMAAWTVSGDAIITILLGGSRVFYGPLAGALILRVLIDTTTRYTGSTSLVLGVLILSIVLLLRKGPVDLLNERRVAKATLAKTPVVVSQLVSNSSRPKETAC